MKEFLTVALALTLVLGTVLVFNSNPASQTLNSNALVSTPTNPAQTLHKTVTVDGVEIFYREAGSKSAPTIVLLHGFPTSSHMFRNLIPALADRFHVVAPDYPGFGNSAMPSVTEFEYTFDHLSEVVGRLLDTLGIERFSLYLQDYGAPIGFRIAVENPERVEALIVQNGNAYEEGLREFWDPFRAYWEDPSEDNSAVLAQFLTLDATIWQFTHGVRDPETISPDTWIIPQAGLNRPGNREIQLQLFYDYRTNLARYPRWQAYLRQHQPPTLVVWGANDVIFPAEGAHPYQRDLNTLEFHLLDTGHFALEEDGEFIAERIRRFLGEHVSRN